MQRRKLKNSELGRMDTTQFKDSDKSPIIVVLDNIRSLNNIGSIFRTSDGLRVQKIYLCGITACPPNRDMHKTALGATESVDWEYREDSVALIKELQEAGVYCAALEQAENAIMLQDFPKTDKTVAIVLGNEVKGVQQEVVDACDACIEIPQFGTKHSFNVSVSAGMCLWDIFWKTKRA